MEREGFDIDAALKGPGMIDLAPRCGVCRASMHRTLSGIFVCRRAACGRPATAIPARRPKPRRVSVLRDPGYLKFLREECGCVVCKKQGVRFGGWLEAIIDAAHGTVNGRGSKGPDNEAVSLCRKHHNHLHSLGLKAFEEQTGIDMKREAAIHWQLYQTLKGTE